MTDQFIYIIFLNIFSVIQYVYTHDNNLYMYLCLYIIYIIVFNSLSKLINLTFQNICMSVYHFNMSYIIFVLINHVQNCVLNEWMNITILNEYFEQYSIQMPQISIRIFFSKFAIIYVLIFNWYTCR